MKASIDQLLREKMKKASVEELMGSFDEEAIWKQVQQANRKKPSSILRFGQQYLRYAAILVLGLLLGFYFDSNTESGQLTAQRVIIRLTKNDTVFIASTDLQKHDNISAVAGKKSARPKAKKRVVIEEPKRSMQKSLVISSAVDPHTPAQENALPKQEKKELAVVYFEDLQKEENPIPVASEKKNKKKFFSIKKPQSGEAKMQELPVRNLLYALNK